MEKNMVPFIQGFGIGAGLIIAIGAQNSFVLSQAVRKQHLFLIPFICSVCDALLISLGASGVGTFVSSNPEIAYYAALGGSLFLFWYGWKALLSAFRSSSLTHSAKQANTVRSTILTTLAITLLNPHVYLDTIVLVGSISGQFEGNARLIFALGACLASIVWFYTLSLGGSLLEPLFRKPLSWKILDISICCIMWSIGFSLLPLESILH